MARRNHKIYESVRWPTFVLSRSQPSSSDPPTSQDYLPVTALRALSSSQPCRRVDGTFGESGEARTSKPGHARTRPRQALDAEVIYLRTRRFRGLPYATTLPSSYHLRSFSCATPLVWGSGWQAFPWQTAKLGTIEVDVPVYLLCSFGLRPAILVPGRLWRSRDTFSQP